MESIFTSAFFVANRQRLRQLFTDTAPIVVAANGLLQRGADGCFAFAQDASFWYLTGIDDPDITLVIDRDKEYLIVPSRSASRETFDGSVEFEPLMRRSGIRHIYGDAEGWDMLNNRLQKVKYIATVASPPAYVEQYGMYTNPARNALAARLKAKKPNLEFLDLSPHLVLMRMYKQPAELQAIQLAIDITISTIKSATRAGQLVKYAYEYEIEAELSRGYRRSGAAGHAFEPIVASGERACTLHYVANNGALAAGELLVIDTGAEVEHYASDITRTRALGKPSRRQQAVHAAVLDVQAYAFGLIRPGIQLKDYEARIEHYLGEKLCELGLIKNINRDEVRKYYPHSASHFMGLNTHDVGDYDRPVEPGIVMTVEPGIYIPEEGVGVRIEDDVLVTETGITILTDKLPRDL